MEEDLILQMYNNGYSVNAISKETGLNKKIITDFLVGLGVYRSHKISCPNDYLKFSDAAKILGFQRANGTPHSDIFVKFYRKNADIIGLVLGEDIAGKETKCLPLTHFEILKRLKESGAPIVGYVSLQEVCLDPDINFVTHNFSDKYGKIYKVARYSKFYSFYESNFQTLSIYDSSCPTPEEVKILKSIPISCYEAIKDMKLKRRGNKPLCPDDYIGLRRPELTSLGLSGGIESSERMDTLQRFYEDNYQFIENECPPWEEVRSSRCLPQKCYDLIKDINLNYLTTSELADLVGIDKRTILSYTKSGFLALPRISNRWSPQEVEAAISTIEDKYRGAESFNIESKLKKLYVKTMIDNGETFDKIHEKADILRKDLNDIIAEYGYMTIGQAAQFAGISKRSFLRKMQQTAQQMKTFGKSKSGHYETVLEIIRNIIARGYGKAEDFSFVGSTISYIKSRLSQGET